MLGTTGVYESTFSTVHFMKSKYESSIFDEKLASELRCTIVSDTQISKL